MSSNISSSSNSGSSSGGGSNSRSTILVAVVPAAVEAEIAGTVATNPHNTNITLSSLFQVS